MVQKSYSAKIPGSLMLFGEHAVLHGYPAIVCTINKYINVVLTPRHGQKVVINSVSLGELEFDLSDIKVMPPFKFVLTAILNFKKQIIDGFDLKISSDFSEQVGLGSSAAVTVAVLSVIHKWLNGKVPDNLALFKMARRIVQQVQGVGSGADIAASVYGGAVMYTMDPLTIKLLANVPQIKAVYSGKKIPTVVVIKKTEAMRKKHPKIFAGLYKSMGNCAEQAALAINKKDWQKLGELMNINQGLLDALGVNNEILSQLIYDLRVAPDILGAKISGSGLGDCVIGLGKLPQNYFPRNAGQKKAGVMQIGINHEQT